MKISIYLAYFSSISSFYKLSKFLFIWVPFTSPYSALYIPPTNQLNLFSSKSSFIAPTSVPNLTCPTQIAIHNFCNPQNYHDNKFFSNINQSSYHQLFQNHSSTTRPLPYPTKFNLWTKQKTNQKHISSKRGKTYPTCVCIYPTITPTKKNKTQNIS